jgi:uncharacterized membrane protein
LSFSLRLGNQVESEITDIELTYSTTLVLAGGAITIEPGKISQLRKKESKTVKVTINPTNPGTFNGEITAKGTYKNQEISTSIPVSLVVSSGQNQPIDENNCSELGGAICQDTETCKVNYTAASDTYVCCVPSSNCQKKSTSNAAIIIVIIVVVILVVILILVMRKPKKQMQEFLKETTKEYEKKFQRPLKI